MTPPSSEMAGLFRSPPHRYVDVGNGALAVRTVGAGPDVLFVHGWPVSGATFRNLLPYLVGQVRCHVLDLVGADESRFDRTVRLGIAEHADAVRSTVAELELDDVAVVGHDSGGMIARHALAGDRRVRAWGLIDTEQPQGANWRFRAFLAMRYLPGFERLLAAALNSRVRSNRFILGDCFADRDLLDGEFAEFFLRPLRDPDRRWAAAEFGRRFTMESFAALSGLHARIDVPVQLVWGGRDPFFPLQRTREMTGTFSGPVRLAVIDEAKLFVHEEFSSETADALLPALIG